VRVKVSSDPLGGISSATQHNAKRLSRCRIAGF
jgi:hypothetical protein